jgi:hypothetical protein
VKKILLLFAGLIVLIIGIGLIFDYVSHKGQFTKWSHSTLGRELLEDGKTFYVGYDFKWEGFGNPTLEKVELIKKDGIILAKDDDQFRIEPFVSKQQLGSFDEDSAIKEGITDELIPVKGYKVNNDFSLVLRAQLADNETNNDINTVRITYKKFGIVQFQNIPFEEGIISGE